MHTATIARLPAASGPLDDLRPPLRVFVASPGGLEVERARARQIIEDLAGRYREMVRIDATLWEDTAYAADRSFQEQIPDPAGFDAVICLFWNRLGSPLPVEVCHRADGTAYESGTVYEYEIARAACGRAGGQRPALYVYRKLAGWRIGPGEAAAAARDEAAVEAFWKRWFQRDDGSCLAAFDTFRTPDEFADRLSQALEEDWLGRRLALAPDRARWNILRDGSPFRALEPFRAEHHAVFAGRGTAIRRATGLLRDAAEPYLLIRGASGCGKSSLAQAGVVPLVAADTATETWRSAVFLPGTGPLAALAAAIRAAVGPDRFGPAPHGADPLADHLGAAPEPAAEMVAGLLGALADERRAAECRDQPMQGRLLLVADQLEEALAAPPEAQQRFVAALRALLRTGAVWCVATLRSDREAALLETPLKPLADPAPWGAVMPLARPDAIAAIIEDPASLAGLTFETRDGASLADRLRADFGQQQDALPLLQMALQQIYQRDVHGTHRTLSFDSYAAIGGLRGAIAAKADSVVAELGAPERAELPALLLSLAGGVTETGEVVSRPLLRADFATSEPRRHLLDRLERERLLVADDTGLLRVAHEALLRNWDQARSELAAVTAARRFVRRLSSFDTDWRTTRPILPPGPLLSEGSGLRNQLEAAGEAAAAALVRASAEAQAAALAGERRKQRLFRRVAIAAGALAVAALCMAGVSAMLGLRARQAQDRAERNFAAAAGAVRSFTEDLSSSLLDHASAPVPVVQSILLPVETLLHDLRPASGEDDPRLVRLRTLVRRQFARTLLLQGDSAQAREAAESALVLEQQAVPPGGDAAGHEAALLEANLTAGAALSAVGEFAAAAARFEAAGRLAAALTARHPEQVAPRLGRAEAQLGLGDMRQALNDPDGAMAAYRDAESGLALAAERRPADAALQRELVEARDRIAALRIAAGDAVAAHRLYLANLQVMERLAADAPGDPRLQNDLSVSRERLGSALMALQPPAIDAALGHFTAMLALRERLLEADPANTKWARNVASAHEAIALAWVGRGEPARALSHAQSALAIRQELARRDPLNVVWPHATILSALQLADIRQRLGDVDGAAAAALMALPMAERLMVIDHNNHDWMDDLVELLLAIARTELQRGEQARDPAEAVALYRSSLSRIDRALAVQPDNARARRLRYQSLWRLASALPATDRAEARADAAAALALADELARTDDPQGAAGLRQAAQALVQRLEAVP